MKRLREVARRHRIASSRGARETLPLVVELRKSRLTITVPPEQTVLEALETNGIPIQTLCRAGICGTCETRVLATEPPRADRPESPGAVQRSQSIRLCVTARGRIARLVLDL
jgi:ferredoxin